MEVQKVWVLRKVEDKLKAENLRLVDLNVSDRLLKSGRKE